MPKEIAWSIWNDLMHNGTPQDMISFIGARIMENGTFAAFILMLWTLALRFLLISFYFTLMYFGVAVLKKSLRKKLSIRASYDCWYVLLFGFVLAYLPFNNRVMVLPSYIIHFFDLQGDKSYAFFAVRLLAFSWLFIVVFKLLVFTRMNRKIKKSMKRMERYDDNEGLAERAASALGLRRVPDIMIACYIETPVSYGVLNKKVLLPDDYEEKYSPVELYLLLLHEMTHISHGDTVKLFIVSLTECFLWSTPVMRLIVKSFKRDSEILCDNRVIGLQYGERDTYGNLILKECACKTARFGFGFSDSYHAVENRLDALYRYKPDKHLKLLAIMPVTVLMICVLSFAFRADWFIVNDKYNSEFMITVFDQVTGEYLPLLPEDCAGACEIVNTPFGESVNFNDNVLREITGQYAVDGIISLNIVSNNYVVHAGETDLSSGSDNHYTLSAEESESQELSVTLGIYLKQRTFAEYLFLLITSKM